MKDYLNQTPVILNIGLSMFAADLDKQGITAAQVNWAPSPVLQKDQDYDPKAEELLDGLM